MDVIKLLLALDGSRKTSQLRAVTVATALTSVLGCADFMTSSEISFSIFYLIPITAAVILSGRQLGLIFSVICALVWITADIASGLDYHVWHIPVWNTLVRFGYFTFHTVLLNQLLTTISMIQAASLQDPLTKAANWRYFEQYSRQLLQQAGRDNIKMTIAYIDVDNFKKINDSFGHGVGDEVLIQIAQTIQSQIRSQDMIARLGGDEFAVVLNNTDLATSQEILDRIRRATLQEMQAKNWDVTLSIGAMVFSVLPMTITPMLKMVDNLMYDVKKNGKDNIKILEQDMRFF